MMLTRKADAGRVRAFIPCLFREDYLVADLDMLALAGS
jgi:hypothetical protein